MNEVYNEKQPKAQNTFFWGYYGPITKVIDELEENGVVNVKHIVAPVFDEKRKKIATTYNAFRLGTLISEYPEAYQYYSNVSFDQDVYNSVYQIRDLFYFFQERNTTNNIQCTLAYLQECFSITYNYLYGILKKENIEVVLFSNMPHVGEDIILYHLAKALNIKTYIFNISSFPNKVFYSYTIEDFGNFEDMNEQLYTDASFQIPKDLETPHHMPTHTSLVKRWTKAISLRKKISKILRNLRHKSFEQIFHTIITDYKWEKFRTKTLAVAENVDYTKKYVYFPLHYQPELTTCPLGGHYNDQVLALERLSELIPDDWIIYVKENPKQTSYMRGDLFFDRIKMFPKVKMVSIFEETFDLIQHAQFVATITGTAGWEAIQKGIPALVFGQAWYKTFEGVFSYHTKLDFNDIVACQINKTKLEEDVNNLLNRMPNFLTDCAASKIYPEFDEKVNYKAYAAFITHLLQKQGSVQIFSHIS